MENSKVPLKTKIAIGNAFVLSGLTKEEIENMLAKDKKILINEQCVLTGNMAFTMKFLFEAKISF